MGSERVSTKRSFYVPEYISASLEGKKEREAKSRTAVIEARIKKEFEEGVMSKQAFKQHVDHNYHGHGVREALADGSVWEESGGKIYRKQECQREVEAVLRALNNLDEEGN